MPALSIDALPELLAPRGYVPAAEPPAPIPAPNARTVDVETGAVADEAPRSRLARLLAEAAAARARMAYDQAAALCAEGAAAARDAADGEWAARFAGEAAALGLLSPPGGEPPLENAGPGASAHGGPARGRQRLNAAIALALAGDPSAALAELDAAEAEIGADDGFGRLLVLLNRAQAWLERGDLRPATAAAADALRMARREKQEYWTALAGLSVALTHLARGRYNEARARLGEAARTFARHGDALRQIQCHYLLGEVAYIGEDPIRAGTNYRDGLAVARPAGAQAWIELLTLRFEHR
jgi:tetratricopeptide (TPR) repeat protein